MVIDIDFYLPEPITVAGGSESHLWLVQPCSCMGSVSIQVPCYIVGERRASGTSAIISTITRLRIFQWSVNHFESLLQAMNLARFLATRVLQNQLQKS